MPDPGVNEREKREKLAKLQELKRLKSNWRLRTYEPYPKQQEFHHAQARERALFAGNRCGKTWSAGMEVAMHLTGLYPDWWQGRRFSRAVRIGIGSETGDLLKKGPQRVLMGDNSAVYGTGTIPKDLLILPPKMSRGIPDGIDTVQVRHCTGGQPDGEISEAVFLSYAEGRTKWQSDEWTAAWLDEEPPLDIYTEALTRTNTTLGPVLLTFTPLKGMTDVAMRFVQHYPDTALIGMSIEDALHFTPEQRETIIRSYPAHERDARTKGLPMLGEGQIFKISQEEISVKPFAIPKHWAVIGGMDFGIDHPFAAVKLAWDRDADVVYLTHAYRQRGLTPIGHASALKHWGNIPWAWPHDGLIRDKQSGRQLAQFYRDEGLGLLSEHAQYPDERGNGLEASITDLSQRMESGRFKVFEHHENWFEEFRFYHRRIINSADGTRRSVPVAERDDLLSATRYAVMCLHYSEIEEPLPKSDRYNKKAKWRNTTWMAN